jgi:hypothetical protein
LHLPRFLIQWLATGRQKRITSLQLRFDSETEAGNTLDSSRVFHLLLDHLTNPTIYNNLREMTFQSISAKVLRCCQIGVESCWKWPLNWQKLL